MTILEAMQWAEAELKSTLHEKTHAVHAPKFDAQILLAFALEKSNAYLVAHFADPIHEAKQERFKQFIARRKAHEPIAYILERKAFYGRDFFVNQHVLIPRPETELMMDEAKRLLTDNSLAIDVGTGSGAVAITVAKETGLPIIAIDNEEHALEVAFENAKMHNVAGKISFMLGNLLTPYIATNTRPSEPHGMILANLPYVPEGTWAGLDPDVRDYEPKNAITAGIDGLDLYDELLNQITENRQLFPKVLDVLMEIDPSQEKSLPKLVRGYAPNADIQISPDLSGKPRMCRAQF